MSKQFKQWSGYAFHLRRRLSASEQAAIGDAIDCRGSGEGIRRLAAVRDILPQAAIEFAIKELNNQPIPAREAAHA